MLLEIGVYAIVYFFIVDMAANLLPASAGWIAMGAVPAGVVLMLLAMAANAAEQGRIYKGGYITQGKATRWDRNLSVTGNSLMNATRPGRNPDLTIGERKENNRTDGRLKIIAMVVALVLFCLAAWIIVAFLVSFPNVLRQ